MAAKHEPGAPQFCEYGNCVNTAKYEVVGFLNNETRAQFCARHKESYENVIQAFSGNLEAFLMVRDL